MAKQKLNDVVLEEINGGIIEFIENKTKLYYDDTMGCRKEYRVVNYDRAKLYIDYLKANQTEEEAIIAVLKKRGYIS